MVNYEFRNFAEALKGEVTKMKITETEVKGRIKLHADIAHPINSQCRRGIQDRVIAAFEEELEKSTRPGYEPTIMDIPEEDVPQVV